MYPEFSLNVCKDSFQRIVCVRYVQLWVVTECPQPRHIAFEAEICASEPLMLVSSPRDSTVLHPFLEEVPPSVMPPVQIQAELLLAGSCHSTCQLKQFPCCRQFRIDGEVSAYNHHLVELAHLDGVWPEGLKKSTNAVTEYAMDDKSILPEPSNSLHIVGNRFMMDKLVPEDFVTKSILDDQQTKITTPISGIHVDDHILVPGNDTDMAHGLQTTPYRALGHAIMAGKLGKGLLAFNIFTDKYLIVNTETTNGLTAAGLTLIALLATTETVLYGKTAATIKANFLPYYIKEGKDTKYQANTPPTFKIEVQYLRCSA